MLRRYRLLIHITRVCTTLTFSFAVVSLGRPECPSSSRLSLPLLNSAVQFFLPCYKKQTTSHEVFMNFFRRHSFLKKYLITALISSFSILQVCRTPLSKSALHKQPSVTAYFSHSLCPSIRSTDKDFNSLKCTSGIDTIKCHTYPGYHMGK